MRRGLHESKARKGVKHMKAEQAEQIRGELLRGFTADLLGGTSAADLGSTFSQYLPRGVVTALSGEQVSAESLVLEVAGQFRPVDARTRSIGESSPEESTPKKPRNEVNNVAVISQRNTAHSELERELNNIVNSSNSLILDAIQNYNKSDSQKDEDFRGTLKQRYDLFLVCLGKKAAVQKGDDGVQVTFDSIDIEEEVKQISEDHMAVTDTETLQQ